MSPQRSAAIAQAFASAAEYDRHARVQRLVARELARRIVALPLPATPRVLEIGCGTGFLAQALREEGLRGDWTITDVSPAMVARARSRLAEPEALAGPTQFAVLDGERDTPEGGPFDLVCASLASQWFDDEPAALARWQSWLAPGGHVMAATLGPGTFAEWRAAHAALGLQPGTPAFTHPHELAPLGGPEPAIDIYRERHRDARAFLHALRAIGAGTAASAHRPLAAGALRRVMRRFEADGAIATYEVVTCHLTHANGAA